MAKKVRRLRRSARVNTSVSAAIKSGRAMAEEVIAFRTARTRKRSTAVKLMARAPKRRRAPAAPRIPSSRTRAMLGSPVSAGVLVAEGDSWFDYPFHDVLSDLEDITAYDVEAVAHKGDTVEDMAYSDGQFDEFARRLDKVLRDKRHAARHPALRRRQRHRRGRVRILLNHAASAAPASMTIHPRRRHRLRLRDAYARILSGLTGVCTGRRARPSPSSTTATTTRSPTAAASGVVGDRSPARGCSPVFGRRAITTSAKNYAPGRPS